MRESRTSGSARGDRGNSVPYRDNNLTVERTASVRLDLRAAISMASPETGMLARGSVASLAANAAWNPGHAAVWSWSTFFAEIRPANCPSHLLASNMPASVPITPTYTTSGLPTAATGP
jgi:hypothetical protein